MKRSTDPLLSPHPMQPRRPSVVAEGTHILMPEEHEAWVRAAQRPAGPDASVEPFSSFRDELLKEGETLPLLAILRAREWNIDVARRLFSLRARRPLRVLIIASEPLSPPPDAGLCDVIDPAGPAEAASFRIARALDELERERKGRELEAEAEYWKRSVDHLNQIGVALSTEPDLAKLLNLIVQQARELICADAGSLYLVSGDGRSPHAQARDLTQQKMRFEVSQNDSVEFPFRTAVMDISKNTIYGYVALTQETVVLEDAYKIPPNTEYSWGGRAFDSAMRYRTKSMLTVPLVDWGGKSIGALQLINRKENAQVRLSNLPELAQRILPFSAQDIRLAHSIASQASIAIQNALLVESVRSRLQGLVTASEERFRNLIEGSVQGVAIYRDLKPIFANHAYARILGYTGVPEFLAKFSFEETFPYYESSRIRAVEKVDGRDSAAQRVYEVQATRREGQTIWLASIARQVTWEGGPVVQVTVNDISSRKAAELKLKASEERFRNLIEGSVQGFVIHRHGEILFANDALARIFGFPSARSLTDVRGWNDLIAPEDRPRVCDTNESRLDGKAAPARYEFQGVHFNSSALWLEVAERVVEWEGTHAIQGILSDITERKRADAVRLELERQIQHRQKLESLGVLAGGLAHDFNNILTGILGNAELAAQDLPNDHPVRDYVDRIFLASQRASHLTRQMLAYAGKGKVRVEPIDLNETIRAMQDLLHAAIPKHVRVISNLRPDLGRVEGDVAQIEQVIMNLITNAAEAIGDQDGQIEIATDEIDLTTVEVSRLGLKRPLAPGRYISLVVSDTGSGMTDEVKARIFEPFFTTKFTGRGLGMSAVLGIVRSHKGAIDLETAPGKGTTFRVYLPAATGLGDAIQADVRPIGDFLGSDPSRGKILVVDDEEVVQQVLRNMLESLGFEVELAGSGPEGIARLEADPLGFRLLFLDLTMPGLQPEETLKRMRRICANLPVVLCSGYGWEHSLQRFGNLELGGYLQKPFALAQLIHTIESVLAPARAGTPS